MCSAVSHDQKTYLAGNIARALAVFCVDEVVIFNDDSTGHESASSKSPDVYTATSDPCHFLAHLLSFLETPPHLRKTLFPMHPNLKTAGTLPSLDMPHHLRREEWCDYREGVVKDSTAFSTSVDVGLPERRSLNDTSIPKGSRVTLKLDQNSLTAIAVSPTEPREAAGYYWGYVVRRCPSLSTVLTESPFEGGYDLCMGTSERGTQLKDLISKDLPPFNHLIIVFGGVAGLETAARNDSGLHDIGISAENVGELFDEYVNVLPGQGSRTIRTEEAIWIGLMGLRSFVEQRGSVKAP